MTDIFVPDSPRDLGLPKDSWLPGQKETVVAVLEAFIGGKKYVMLGAPTGAGKSLVAAAVQKLLARSGGGAGGRSIALTHTIQLQQQYIKTLPDAAVITGRGNHDCDLPKDDNARIGFTNLSAEDAPCSTGDGCSLGLNRRGGCSYYDQFWKAADSPMVTMNYAYAARILQQDWVSTGERDVDGKRVAIRNPFRRSLLVADECHLAEKAIVEANGVRINVRLLSDLGVKLPAEYTRQRVTEGRAVREYETTGVWVAWAIDAKDKVVEAITRVDTRIEYLTGKFDNTPKATEELVLERIKMKRLNALLSALTTTGNIDALHYEAWRVKREKQPNGTVTAVVVQPLWGWSVAQETLWQWFDKVLLMSATPGDPDIERIKLGIPKDEFVFIERPSFFPKANRPVIFWPVAKLSYSSGPEDWEQIANAIQNIATSGQWAERKGLVHSGSKVNARRLVAMLNARVPGKRFFTHGDNRGDAAAALESYKRSPEPLILVTASFTTGLDLPYIIGWQVIAKVPYGSLADEVTASRRAFKDAKGIAFGQRVYQSEAMNTVVQAAGRIVRTADDSGPTFILDGNYAILHRLAWKPAFYTEAYRQFSVAH